MSHQATKRGSRLVATGNQGLSCSQHPPPLRLPLNPMECGNSSEKGECLPLDKYFYPLFKAHGLILRGRIVWTFGHGHHATRRFSSRYETILGLRKAMTICSTLTQCASLKSILARPTIKGRSEGNLRQIRRARTPVMSGKSCRRTGKASSGISPT